MESIREIMEDEGQHVVFDVDLIKRLRDFNISFINRNNDHIQYFGSQYTGVYQAKFKNSDRDLWFDIILDGFDERSAYSRVVKLPTLKPEWKRATDVMNLACLWLAHHFLNSKKLSAKDKQEGILQALTILNIKFLTSLTNSYFAYPVNIDIARAVIDRMNNKYILKKVGSWKGFIDHRNKEIIKPTSPNYKSILYFDDDKEIIDSVSDIQLRFRQAIKGVWKVLDEVLKSQKKVNVIGNTLNLDGEQVIRDVTRDESKYVRYAHTVLQDKTRFFKEELIDIIVNISPTMSPRAFLETLEYVQENSHKPSHKNIYTLVDETILHSIQFLRRSPETRRLIHNVGDLTAKLRANYASSTSSDPALLKMRKLGYDIVKKSTGLKNDASISAVRTGLLLYIILRTYSMKHYG